MPTRDPVIRGDTENRRASINAVQTAAMIAIVIQTFWSERNPVTACKPTHNAIESSKLILTIEKIKPRKILAPRPSKPYSTQYENGGMSASPNPNPVEIARSTAAEVSHAKIKAVTVRLANSVLNTGLIICMPPKVCLIL
jgi:hypothetical protein